MYLLFFWLKIAVNRIISLIKRYPVVVIGFIIIIASFKIGINDENVAELGFGALELIILFFTFALASLLISLKNYDTASTLLRYSKSSFTNRKIHVLFFVLQAFVNNFPLFITAIFLTKMENFLIFMAVLVFSLAASFLIMYIKHNYKRKKTGRAATAKPGINPYVKSILYDYAGPDFLFTAAACIIFLLIIAFEFTRNMQVYRESDNLPVNFITVVFVFSFGFLGILSSIPYINWKFHRIIAPKEFGWHIKRTMLFLGIFFGLFLLLFIIIAFLLNAALLPKYLYCLFIQLLIFINVSFTINPDLIKVFLLVPITIFTAWISAMPAAMLPILIAPVLITFIKARNDYRTRYYL